MVEPRIPFQTPQWDPLPIKDKLCQILGELAIRHSLRTHWWGHHFEALCLTTDDHEDASAEAVVHHRNQLLYAVNRLDDTDDAEVLIRQDPICTFTDYPTGYDHIGILPLPCTLCCVHIIACRFNAIDCPIYPATPPEPLNYPVRHLVRNNSLDEAPSVSTLHRLKFLLHTMWEDYVEDPQNTHTQTAGNFYYCVTLTRIGFTVNITCATEQLATLRHFCDTENIFTRMLLHHCEPHLETSRIQVFIPDGNYDSAFTPNAANTQFWQHLFVIQVPYTSVNWPQ